MVRKHRNCEKKQENDHCHFPWRTEMPLGKTQEYQRFLFQHGKAEIVCFLGCKTLSCITRCQHSWPVFCSGQFMPACGKHTGQIEHCYHRHKSGSANPRKYEWTSATMKYHITIRPTAPVLKCIVPTERKTG